MSGARLAQRLFGHTTVLRRVELLDDGPEERPSGTVRMSLDRARASREGKRQREALLAAVACHMEAEAWHECGVSKKAIMPAVKRLKVACRGSIRCGWTRLSPERQRMIYCNRASKTLLERGDGFMPAIQVSSRRRGPGLLSVSAGASLFASEVMTSALADKTRSRYHDLWRGFVTYAIAQRKLDGVLPASKELVQAWAMQLLMLGASPSLIRASLAAVQSRHSDYGLTPPLSEPRLFRRTMQAVCSLQGTPRRIVTPVTRSMMRKLLRMRNLTLGQQRDVALTVVGTQACCRVGEIKRFQVCDFLPDHDAAVSSRYVGSAALRIRKRKQDRRRRGLYPRLMKGTRPEYCAVQRIKDWIVSRGLAVSRACTKRERPAARCPHCPPLFPSFRQDNGSWRPMSRQQVSGAVKKMLSQVYPGEAHFSGISMRRGGISQAVHARVPEPILYLQSGHGSGCAARSYIVPEDPRVLYESARALRV